MKPIILTRFYLSSDGLWWGIYVDGTLYQLGDEFSWAKWLFSTFERVPEAIEEVLDQAKYPRYRSEAVRFEEWFLLKRFYPETEKRGIYWHSLFYEEQIEIWTVGNGNLYGHSNTTERPILFFKGHGRDVVGHTQEVGIRYDAVKSISTPAIGVILNRALEVVGYTIGNDMSSSDIEGENPLYLSQARVYRASCALGPGILLSSSNEIPSGGLKMRIERAGQIVFQGETHTDNIVHRLPELIDYLGRCNDFNYGVVLLINTEIVLPSDFTLHESDVIHISIDNIGTLTNRVKVV